MEHLRCFSIESIQISNNIQILASSRENLFMPYVNNNGADQPAHPRSLISTFIVRCLDSIIPPVSISKISSLHLASVAAQAGLSLTWSQTPKTGFFVTRLICDHMYFMAVFTSFSDFFSLAICCSFNLPSSLKATTDSSSCWRRSWSCRTSFWCFTSN